MNPAVTQPPDLSTVRCPTCRASQEWSDTCRRCRSDLRLLRTFATSYAQTRLDCLGQLNAGRFGAARALAQRCHTLAPSDETRRLLTVVALRLKDWPAVAELGQACHLT